jgi:DnaA-homolog protein
MKPDQLPLAIRWPAYQRFDSFLIEAGDPALDMLRSAATAPAANWIYLNGAVASGKTHLLIAACAVAGEYGRSAQYISLRNMPARSDIGSTIRELGGNDLLAIDDVDAIAGNRGAEHALFDLYNSCKVEKCTLLFAAAQAPAQIGVDLPDLVSRLAACTQIVLKPLDEAGRRSVLAQRAQARGLTFDEAVLDWLFAHHARDLRSLTELFERVDKAALAAQRRITVPFLRNLLGS